VHIGLIPHQAGFDIFQNNFGNVLCNAATRGERIVIEGRVLDGTGTPVRDALVEIWQANADGRYNHPADRQNKPLDPDFRGWGRTGADFKTGLYTFDTIKPGPVTGRDGRIMAPHINVWIVSRGINIGLNTRMYFSDETEANAADPVLNLVEQDERRATLIAKRIARDGKAAVYRFDIVLQCDNETVFFDV
jgi:protocatechuate 3,4-dioxygenase alpha subunit